MNTSLIQNQNREDQLNPNNLLKVTSLEYLKEALRSERYEECPELIKIAKEFGAQPQEVEGVISEHIRWVKKGKGNPSLIFPRSKGEP